ncbi:MAG: hypothetical protein KA383_19475 [Phycisphaerae bacterium]|nr:hypothetical protein [Phycisphaerae bacterium]
MSPAVKNGILLAVLLVVLGGAAFFFTRKDKETSYPTTGYETTWMCEKCGKHFELSPAQYKDWVDSKDKMRRDSNYPPRLTVFWCDNCQAYSVVRAVVNKATGEWELTADSQGNPPKGAGGGAKSGTTKPPKK